METHECRYTDIQSQEMLELAGLQVRQSISEKNMWGNFNTCDIEYTLKLRREMLPLEH